MLHEFFDKQPAARKPTLPHPEQGPGLVEDFGSFGWLRNERDRAVMLEIRQANGIINAFNYSWLESAVFNPSEGIRLNFSGTTIQLAGCNLNTEYGPNIRLFAGMLQHRVLWIQEVKESTTTHSFENEVVIDQITVI